MQKLIGIMMASMVMLMSAEIAEACGCIPPRSQQATFEAADAVFLGKVLKNELVNDGSTREMTVEVIRYWKGVSQKEVLVYSYGMGSTCSASLEVGQTYLLYSSKYKRDPFDFLSVPKQTPDKEAFSIGLCSRNIRLDFAEKDLKELGPGIQVR